MNITAKRSCGFQNDQVLKENQLMAENPRILRKFVQLKLVRLQFV